MRADRDGHDDDDEHDGHQHEQPCREQFDATKERDLAGNPVQLQPDPGLFRWSILQETRFAQDRPGLFHIGGPHLQLHPTYRVGVQVVDLHGEFILQVGLDAGILQQAAWHHGIGGPGEVGDGDEGVHGVVAARVPNIIHAAIRAVRAGIDEGLLQVSSRRGWWRART